MADGVSRQSSGEKVQTINSIGMGRLVGKNAIVTGAAGYVSSSSYFNSQWPTMLQYFPVVDISRDHWTFDATVP